MVSKVVEAVLKVTNQTGAGLAAAGKGFDDLAARAERASSKATAAMNRQERTARKLGTTTVESNKAQASSLAKVTNADKLRASVRARALDDEVRSNEKARISAEKYGKTLSVLGDNHVAAQQLGRTMAITGAVVGSVFAGMAAAAVSWESAWAGVTKTVDGADSALENDLRGLAKVLPSTHTEIAAVAENAGQLGISRKGLVQFTQTAIELGNTTNLSAEQASTSIAQLINIMGDGEESVGRIGSTIVDLGNKGASTETQIVEMGQRIAGSGRQIGLSTPEVLGLANAIASTGIEAEAGGSAASQSLQKIDTAVRAGGKGLETLARVSGKTTTQFAADFRAKPQEAITEFVEGLGKLQASGGDVTGALKDIGVTGIRETDVLRRLASATKAAGNENNLLRDSFNVANGAFQKNTALVVEAQKRYETTASRMQIARNQIVDAGISGGQAILPILGAAAKGAGDLADKFSNLSPEVQGFVAKAAGVSAVALLAGGGLLSAASSASQLYMGFRQLAESSPALAGKLRGVGGALAAVTVALAAMSAAGALTQKYWGDAPVTLGDAGQAIAGLGQDAAGAQPSLDKFFSFNNDSGLGHGFESIKGIGDAFAYVKQTGSGFEGFMDGVINKIPGVTGASEKLNDRFAQIDQTLTSLGTAGSPAAAQGFETLRKQAELQGVPLQKLVDLFPQYRDQVLQAASAQKYTFTSTEELAQAMGGKLPEAMLTQSDAFKRQDKDLATARSSLEQLTASHKLSAASAQAVAKSLFTVSSAAIDASNAQIAYRQAVEQASKSKGGGISMDSEKGRSNLALLNQQASAYQAVAQSMVLTGKSGKDVAKATQGARDDFISNAKAMGVSSGKAADLADKYGLIPKKVQTEIDAKLRADAATQIATLMQLDGTVITPEIQAKINQGDYKGALSSIKELQKKRKAEVEAHANTGKAKSDLQAAAKKREAALEAQAKRVGEASGQLNNAAKKRVAAIIANAQSKKADGALDHTARGRTAKVTAQASTSAAESALNQLTRARTVSVKVKETGRIGADIATGGFVAAPGVVIRRHAAGGRIGGSGGPTQDNVAGVDRTTGVQTSWVSVGEFVTNAQSYANNSNVVETVNRNPSKKYALQELATGGAVGSSAYDYDTILKLVRTKDDPYASVVKAAAALTAENKKIAKQISSKEKAEARYDSAISRRVKAQDNLAALKKEHASKKAIAKANKELEASDRAVTRANKDKTAATKAYDKVADKSKEATQELEAAQKSLADQARQVSGSIVESYGVQSGAATGKGLLSSMQNGAKRAALFEDLLRQLKALGLSDQLMQEIAEKGPQGGGIQLAQSILKDPSLVTQLNASRASLQQSSDDVGYTSATSLFGPAPVPAAPSSASAVPTTSTSARLAAPVSPVQALDEKQLGTAVADALKGMRWEATFDGTGVSIFIRNEVGQMISSARRT